MNVIKRSGVEVTFDPNKIKHVVDKANTDLAEADRIPTDLVGKISDNVVEQCEKFNRALHVEEIQDIVEKTIADAGYWKAAKAYTNYRLLRQLRRQKNTIDDSVLSLVDGTNEDLKQENSNKNPTVNSVQRDYVAGEVSKDISRRTLLPKDVVEMHDKGIAHFHDMDYYIQHMFNCCLVNLEDMLQNGTVISGNAIDKPKSFLTACTIATQISAAVASNQYGGQTMTLTHLAPFVDVSRQKIRKQVENEVDALGLYILEPGNEPEEQNDKYVHRSAVEEIVENRVRKEVRSGVQTIQYQVSTIASSNGQAPFITLFMYLNEAKNEQEKKDLALIIEEVLKQRIQGVKNEVGVYVTPAFPKLVYAIEEDNVRPGTEYWYLTELAAKCTAKRMVPDYISEKIMKQLKVDKWGTGYCYSPMGLV